MKVTKMKPHPTDPLRMGALPKRRNDDGDVTMHVHVGGYYKKRLSLLNLLKSDVSRNKV
jgi:hypothetical protein